MPACLTSPAIKSLRRIGLLMLASALSGCVGQAAAGPPPAPNPYGYTCYAGPYICRLPAQYRVGTSCTCPGLGAPSFGTVH